jgi:16S rRNA G966 N2-methylase RsmD
VFADPPYALDRIADLPTSIYESGVAKAGAFVVMEHSRETPVRTDPSMFEVTTKPFGQTTVLFMRCVPPRRTTELRESP